MNISRRRVLTIAAAAAVAGPLPAQAETLWQGHALGAAASIILRGPHGATGPALSAAIDTLRRIEGAFSLYDPGSELSRLNRDGRLAPLSRDMRALLAEVERIHAATDGLFDPTVQSLWTGRGGAPGWARVAREPVGLTLAEGQSLTLNGIAQGFATDAVSAVLADHGFRTTLISIGEIRGRGGPWRIGVEDPAHGMVGTATLTDGALATSAPTAMRLTGGGSHIVDPRAPANPPLWSSVTVEADDATTADGASTALCFADTEGMRRIMGALPELRRIFAVGIDGDIVTLRG